MTYETLENFLQFLIDNDIKDLTILEKKFIRKTPYNITLNDLIKWYNSDLRKSKLATRILSKERISRDIFLSLISLSHDEIIEMMDKYVFKDESSMSFSLIAYAKLKKNLERVPKKKKEETLENYKQIIDWIITLNKSQDVRFMKLDAINHPSILETQENEYSDLYRIALCTINENDLKLINQFLSTIDPYSLDIARSVVFLILDKHPKSLEEINLYYDKDVLHMLDKKDAVRGAITYQDSFEGVKAVIDLSLSSNLYKEEETFERIYKTRNANKIKNARTFYNKYSPKLQDINWFMELSEDKQEEVLEKLKQGILSKELDEMLEESKRIRKDRFKKRRMIYAKFRKELDDGVDKFFTTNSSLEENKELRKKLRKDPSKSWRNTY